MKRLLAFLLCLVLALSLIPAAAAEDIEIIDPETEEELIPIVEPADEPEQSPPGPGAEIQANGTCGDHISWSLNSDGILSLTGYGDMVDYDLNGNKAPWYDNRTQIKVLEIGYGIESIGNYAFYGCINMTLDPKTGYSITDDVQRIGQGAFVMCHRLTSVCIPESVTAIGGMAFETCNNLKRVTICGKPSIGALAFAYCRSLAEFSFLGSAPSMASDVFSNTPQMRAWYPPNDSTWTESVRGDYSGSVTWWEGWHGWCGDDIEWDLDTALFRLSLNGSGETWSYLPASGPPARASFAKLENKIFSAFVSDGVTVLNDGVFYGLYRVTEVVLPDTLTEIGRSCFNGCGLAAFKIPASVTKIGSKALADCEESGILFLGHAPEISDDAFYGSVFTAYYYPVDDWTADKMLNYGGSVSWECDDRIGESVTWSMSKSGKLTLSGSGATWDFFEDTPDFRALWQECTSVSVGSGISALGECLFEDMDSLKSVTIPAGVTSVGYECFENCRALEKVVFKGSAPEFGSYCFYKAGPLTAYYPENEAGWTDSVMKNYGSNGIEWVGLTKPAISTQPASKTASVGTTVKFTVKATGGALSYQWYYRTSSTGEWKKSTATGAKTAMLSIKAESYRSGYQYRCKVSNPLSYKYSSAATLTVGSKPTVTTQPKSAKVYVGKTAKFTVKASDATGYQWYYRTSSTGEWKKCSGSDATTASISVEAKSYRDGYQYRCKVSNSAGYVYSSAATLTVSVKPVITTQPSSKTASSGTTVKFTVKADGASSYQWYYRTSETSEWKKCTGTGATTATLSVEAKSYRSGYQYRCKVTNDQGYVYSSAATLTVS
ncbi:MAG: leucine-rich repeat protein [Oscillospiraceae bacterium]|nr:leucine-rich repeat protein [Oscillospiraceae bacterium]